MTQLRILVLGAAAGGGFPQWNCGCPLCVRARNGELTPQSQSSIAVSANGTDWAILNASPDIRTQLAASPPLHPTGPRISPIKSVLVTNGDIDHVAGLLTLREKQPFQLFATAEIHSVIADNPIFTAVDASLVPRRSVVLDTPFELAPGLTATLFAVPGKVPLYLEGETVVTDLEGEQTVGVELSAGGKTAFYIPGCAKLTDKIADRVRGAELLLFDGTVWENEEMIRTGVGQKTGARMGHMSMNGENGSMAALKDMDIARKVFIHINNTNPALDPASDERAQIEAAGWSVAQDGMEYQL